MMLEASMKYNDTEVGWMCVCVYVKETETEEASDREWVSPLNPIYFNVSVHYNVKQIGSKEMDANSFINVFHWFYG